MGSQHSKAGKSKRRGSHSTRASSAGSLESLVLSANSLDLIYVDDYFDGDRYLKLVAKRLAERQKKKKEEQAAARQKGKVHHHHHHGHAHSDTAIHSARTSKSKTTTNAKSAPTVSTLTTKSFASSRYNPPAAPPPSKNPSFKSKTTMATGRPSYMQAISSSASKKPEIIAEPSSRPATASSSKKSVVSKKSVQIVTTPPTTKFVPPSSLSTGDIPPKNTDESELSVQREDKIAQTSSWHGETPTTEGGATGGSSSSSGSSGKNDQRDSVGFAEPIKKPRSILTTRSFHQDNSSGTVRRQRSYVIRSSSRRSSPQRSQSVATNWTPKAQPTRGVSFTQPKPASETVTNKPQPKKKLVVRGLKNFVNSRKRDSSLSSVDNCDYHRHFTGGRGEGGGGSGGPAIWKREFPSKSKFHPDNFIYDWPEGPKAPPRPFSAMAKCKKHGGRCNDCGLFTCDLCQSCRKCETDCACPCPVKPPCQNPYTTGEVYQEVFGGDGWNKACKVLCNLTQNDKMHPVGGNASKKKQSCDENWAKNNFYKSQIDVLNPYNVPLNEVPPPGIMQQPFLQHPMCVPSMYPMPFMPMPMMMPPPMMPYYTPPPPCPSYDPCYSPPCPYPASDSFMPTQNY